jgi:hypothetical protein
MKRLLAVTALAVLAFATVASAQPESQKAHVKVFWNGKEVAKGNSKANGTWGPLLLVALNGSELVPVTKTGTFKVTVLPPGGDVGHLCRHTNSRVFDLG